MNKQITLVFLGLALLFNQSSGQSFKGQYNDLVAKNDTAGQLQLLKKWEASDSNAAELYVAYFNFYVNQSRQEVIALGDHPEGDQVLQIMNSDSSANDPVAYLYSSAMYNPPLIAKGFYYADRGIAKNPSRLDLRFGKVYMLGELTDWGNFTSEIIKTIDYSVTIKNKWTWSDDQPLTAAKDFMLSSIQSYQMQLYNTNDDNLLENMRQIADAVLKYYPDHVESLTDLSIVYMIRKEYDKGLEVLFKAEKLAPTDYIVLNNIAQAYKLKGDSKNAIKYYELTMKYGDKQVKQYAKDQIEELEKK
jgi:tetratricopeptide (TPR) repeat protein